MSGGDLSGSLHASWQGAPWEFKPSRVNGKLHLLIKDGQLLGVEPGAGRVFGLVSLGIPCSAGCASISATCSRKALPSTASKAIVLDNGDAYTNDLVIQGPAARIEISGASGWPTRITTSW
jgi:uncharacterized protein YhdP